MHSLIRWPNKTCTVELTECVKRDRNFVRVTRPGDCESHRALRILAQSDDEEFLKNLNIDEYGILHLPLSQLSAGFECHNEDELASGSNSLRAPVQIRPPCSLIAPQPGRQAISRLSVAPISEVSIVPSSIEYTELQRPSTSHFRESQTSPLPSDVELNLVTECQSNRALCVDPTTTIPRSREIFQVHLNSESSSASLRRAPLPPHTERSDPSLLSPSMLATDSVPRDNETVNLKNSAAPRLSTPYEVQSRSPPPAACMSSTHENRKEKDQMTPYCSAYCEPRVDNYNQRQLLSFRNSTAPKSSRIYPRGNENRSRLSEMTQISGDTIFAKNSELRLDSKLTINHASLVNCSRLLSASNTRSIFGKNVEAPADLRLQRSTSPLIADRPQGNCTSELRETCGAKCISPANSRSRSLLRPTALSQSSSMSQLMDESSCSTNAPHYRVVSSSQHRTDVPILPYPSCPSPPPITPSISSSRCNFPLPLPNQSGPSVKISAKGNFQLPNSDATSLQRLTIPLSPFRNSRNVVALIQDAPVFICRETLKRILKETVYCRRTSPNINELARQLMVAIVGVNELLTMTPKGYRKSNLSEIPPQIYKAIYDYVTALLPQYPLDLDTYRRVIGAMCTQLRKNMT